MTKEEILQYIKDKMDYYESCVDSSASKLYRRLYTEKFIALKNIISDIEMMDK